jgi:DNA-directed RNA polymerase specialized sigma24 family protein
VRSASLQESCPYVLDPAIIARAQNGDPQAFRQIVEAYQVVAWKTARVPLRDSTLAEAVVQDAWIDMWRGLPRLQQPLAYGPGSSR